jgi:arylsulfatase A-like enzyme/Flp pilus assembly protein TadD
VRRRAAAALACVLAAACARGPAGRTAGEAKASVLLVTIDTFRADRVGAYGYARAGTPNLDAIARAGVTFVEAVSPVPLTLPAHATILSGLEPTRHGVHDNGTYVFPGDPPTLATVLKAQGWATGAFVGAFVLDRRFGLARGFDEYDDRIGRRRTGSSVLESERPCDAVADAAASWIAGQRGPFLAWVHFYDPHAPYEPPAPFREAHPGRPYDGEIAYADACLGRVVAAARGRAGDHLVVAAIGDHGEGLGDHGERTHGFFVYQSTLRVPFLVAGPGLPRGQKRPGLARAADVAPTLLARAGIAAPAGIDGNDLMAGPAREAYAETEYPAALGFAPLRSLRIGGLKYIEAPRPELYDLDADPGEARDLAAARPGDVRRLAASLAAARRGARSGIVGADPAVAERLRALGYVGGSGAAATGGEDPKDAIALWRRFEEASWADTRGEHARAARLLRDLVAERPHNAAFRRALAAALRGAGRAGEAAAVLADLPSGAAGDPLAWHERALALSAAGRRDEALRAEERALALNPLLPEGHNHRGTLLAAAGRLPDALQAFTDAIRLDPNNADALTNRGNALRGLGRGDEAARDFAAAAARDPSALGARNGLGVLAVEQGDLERAAALFAEVLALDPGYHEARLNLAVVEVRRGRVDAARAHLEEVVRRAPGTDVGRRAAAFIREIPDPAP